MDESKKAEISNLFWEMHTITSRTETKTGTAIIESGDGNGNIVKTKTTVTKTHLYITVEHKSADKMAEQYSFTTEQKEYLTELLADENDELWEEMVGEIASNNAVVVTVAADDCYLFIHSENRQCCTDNRLYLLLYVQT